ncbi:MAG: hypothetical protein FWE02_03415 [Defluviitaleaceae bacterium]|nr:hypothetical protein [Defluviitaleaceae bacterium]
MKMNIIDVAEYEERIKRATPFELVKINYELLFAHIGHVKQEVACGANASEARKMPSVEVFTAMSQMVDGLISGLDLNEQISRELLKTYVQVKACFAEAMAKYHRTSDMTKEILELINIAETHLKIIHEAILQLKDDGVPIYNPKVTAGMSYDKDGNMVENVESTIEFEI